MKKTPRSSLDGFVPRQPDAVMGEKPRSLQRARPELGKPNRPLTNDRRSLEMANQGARDDIDSSLRAIDDEEDVVPKKKRRFFRRKRASKPHGNRRKIIKRVSIGLLIVLIIFGGYFAWKFFLAGGKIFNGNPFDLFQHQRLKEDANGRTNVLIFGTSGNTMNENNGWEGALLTDSIMVLSVNQDTNDAYTISLPRDLYVQHVCQNSLGTTSGKLNETYYCAYQDSNKNGKAGAQALMKTAGSVLGLNVQYYVHANWTALRQGVDAVGGVDVKIESSDPRGIYDVATSINYKNGEVVHLNGERALAFARARNSHGGYGLSGGNFDREKNQQKLLSALQKKATSVSTLANPAAVSGMLDALGDNLRTNFRTSEVQALIDLAKNLKKTTPLPLVGRKDNAPDLVTTGSFGGASIVQPTAGLYNYVDIHSYVAKSLRGTTSATIDVLNGSSTEGLANRKAGELEKAGYIIGKIANAPTKISESVRIYQIDKTKTKAADALEKKFGVSIMKEGLGDYAPKSGTDFIIVFGGS